MKIKDLPSGTIDIVQVGAVSLLQFNASCKDALPYCKGMCCGSRYAYNVILEPEEVAAYASVKVKDQDVLAFDPADMRCIYQDKEGHHCKIYEDRPSMCRQWHCSPEGKGEGINFRGLGFFLAPAITK